MLGIHTTRHQRGFMGNFFGKGGLGEGRVTKAMEQVTGRAPSATYLTLAGISVLGSLALYLAGKREQAIFVGLWPLALLTIGNYNKMVKLFGSHGR